MCFFKVILFNRLNGYASSSSMLPWDIGFFSVLKTFSLIRAVYQYFWASLFFKAKKENQSVQQNDLFAISSIVYPEAVKF